MHIAHVNFARGFRGGERQSLSLIHGLSKLGCKQTLICRPDSDLMRRTQEEAEVNVITAKHPLLGHLRVPHFDLIHVHEARGAYWAWMENRLRGTPYLITRRVINPISSSWLTGQVYRRAALLVGVSADVARRLAVQTGCKVEVVLDSCMPLQADTAARQTVCDQLAGTPIIGHVGVLHDAVKGQATLIAAFKALTTTWPNARLVFVGDGPDRTQLQALAGGDSRIVFAGQQRDVAPWLAAMDVFAFPSRVEALGSSVLDAMMLGVPVVASTAGGLPELTGKDERGLSVSSDEPGDWTKAIRRLLEDEALRLRLVEAGRAFSHANDLDAHAKRYWRLYQAIVKPDNAPSA